MFFYSTNLQIMSTYLPCSKSTFTQWQLHCSHYNDNCSIVSSYCITKQRMNLYYYRASQNSSSPFKLKNVIPWGSVTESKKWTWGLLFMQILHAFHFPLYFDKSFWLRRSRATGNFLGIVPTLESSHNFVYCTLSFALRDIVKNVDSSFIRNIFNAHQP